MQKLKHRGVRYLFKVTQLVSGKVRIYIQVIWLQGFNSQLLCSKSNLFMSFIKVTEFVSPQSSAGNNCVFTMGKSFYVIVYLASQNTSR